MKRAKPDHVKKLTALFEQYPDGLNMRQIQTELQTSPHNTQAALDELGAVKQGAKWLLLDDEVEQVAPGAKADTAVVNENFTTELSGNSGELRITESPCEQTCTAHICGVDQKCFFEKPQLVGDPDQLPKAFDQSVFVGLPSSVKWATVNIDGTGEAWAGVPDRLGDGTWDAYGQCFSLGGGFDGSKWRDIIQREPVASTDVEKQELENPVSEQKRDDAACPMPCIDQPEGEPQGELPKELPEGKCPVCKVATDVAPLGLEGECQMCYEDATDKAWWNEARKIEPTTNQTPKSMPMIMYSVATQTTTQTNKSKC